MLGLRGELRQRLAGDVGPGRCRARVAPPRPLRAAPPPARRRAWRGPGGGRRQRSGASSARPPGPASSATGPAGGSIGARPARTSGASPRRSGASAWSWPPASLPARAASPEGAAEAEAAARRPTEARRAGPHGAGGGPPLTVGPQPGGGAPHPGTGCHCGAPGWAGKPPSGVPAAHLLRQQPEIEALLADAEVEVDGHRQRGGERRDEHRGDERDDAGDQVEHHHVAVRTRTAPRPAGRRAHRRWRHR